MNRARILGDNIKLLLKEKVISKSGFAEALGYSVDEVERLCDARLAVTEEDVRGIAAFFSCTADDLFVRKDEREYEGVGFLHCMGQFKNPDDREKILNIFDMYCDLIEVLEM